MRLGKEINHGDHRRSSWSFEKSNCLSVFQPAGWLSLSFSVRGTVPAQTDLRVVNLWQSFVQGNLFFVFQRQPFSLKVIHTNVCFVHVENGWLEMRISSFIIIFFLDLLLFFHPTWKMTSNSDLRRGESCSQSCWFFFVQYCLSGKKEKKKAFCKSKN